MSFFTAIASFFQSFYTQAAFFYVKKEIFYPVERRVRTVVKRALIIEFIMYSIVGIFGYLSLGNDRMADIFL